MQVLELTVSSCIHLVRSNLTDLIPQSLGSGVIVKYKDRFFICTVSHFSDIPNQNIGIVTGRVKDNQTEIFYLGEFSYLTEIKFEDLPVGEDLEYCFSNPEKSGKKLDIAFREISLLDNIYQQKRVFELNGLGTLTINEGSKTMLIVDDDYQINKDELCSFYGRIRPSIFEGTLHFEEQLYWGLSIKNIGEHFIEIDLGSSIQDPTRFKGCSGSPIMDTRGRLIGLITHGESDTTKSSIYGFRFDKVKQWIDLMYFQ
ncbi:MAG: hypothetical protein RJA76_494 [Bacteroidota bacterium]|jgi:hypothetical protein